MSEHQNLTGRTFPAVDGPEDVEGHATFDGESDDIFRRRFDAALDEAEDVEGHVEPLPRERDELI